MPEETDGNENIRAGRKDIWPGKLRKKITAATGGKRNDFNGKEI